MLDPNDPDQLAKAFKLSDEDAQELHELHAEYVELWPKALALDAEALDRLLEVMDRKAHMLGLYRTTETKR